MATITLTVSNSGQLTSGSYAEEMLYYQGFLYSRPSSAGTLTQRAYAAGNNGTGYSDNTRTLFASVAAFTPPYPVYFAIKFWCEDDSGIENVNFTLNEGGSPRSLTAVNACTVTFGTFRIMGNQVGYLANATCSGLDVTEAGGGGTVTATRSGASTLLKTNTSAISGASTLQAGTSTLTSQIAGASTLRATVTADRSGASALRATKTASVSGASVLRQTKTQSVSGASILRATKTSALSGASTLRATKTAARSGASTLRATASSNTAGASSLRKTNTSTISGASTLRQTKTADRSGASSLSATSGISLVGSFSASAGSGTAASVTHGVSIQAGDVVIVQVHGNTSNLSIADNNGANPFTQDYKANGGETNTYLIASRVCGASEPASFAWTLGSSQRWEITGYVFRGVSSSVWAVPPSASTLAINTGTPSSPATAPSIEVPEGSCGLLIVNGDYEPTTSSWSNPTNGYGSEVEPATHYETSAMYAKFGLTAGATGATSVTPSAPERWVAHQVALLPSGGSTTKTASVSGASLLRQTKTQSLSGSSTLRATKTADRSGASTLVATGIGTWNISGASTLRQTKPQTVSGASRLVLTKTVTRSGASRLRATKTADLSGASRLRAMASSTIQGASTLRKTSSFLLQGFSFIMSRKTSTVSGASGLSGTNDNSLSGASALDYSQYTDSMVTEQPNTATVTTYGGKSSTFSVDDRNTSEFTTESPNSY